MVTKEATESIVLPELFIPGKTLIVGVDESNNGKFPAYFVAILSQKALDITAKIKSEKIRSHKPNLFNQLKKRGYSFLLFEENDQERIPGFKKPGVIVASLLDQEIGQEVENLAIYLDGEYTTPQKSYLRDCVSDYSGLERRCVNLFCGANFDKKIKIVQLADELAHYLFRKYPIQKISKNRHRKTLLL